MRREEFRQLVSLYDSIALVEYLEKAIKENKPIRFTTPFCDSKEITNKNVDEIMMKHMLHAIKEIREYAENVKVVGLEVEE